MPPDTHKPCRKTPLLKFLHTLGVTQHPRRKPQNSSVLAQSPYRLKNGQLAERPVNALRG